jgi:hypothetical protein
MSAPTTATGRPGETLPFPIRILVAAIGCIGLLELALYAARTGALERELPLVALARLLAIDLSKQLRPPCRVAKHVLSVRSESERRKSAVDRSRSADCWHRPIAIDPPGCRRIRRARVDCEPAVRHERFD